MLTATEVVCAGDEEAVDGVVAGIKVGVGGFVV